jgi:UDP-glucuronate decarboxylase
MNRVLVAGGCGFVGSHLVEVLVSRGLDVTVVDNLTSGQMQNLAGIESRVKLVRADISELPSLDPFDTIINLASRASRPEWEKYPIQVCLANSLGQNNLLRLAVTSRARYLFTSTSEVYGDPDEIPTPETYSGRIDPSGSRAPYDESKRFGETLLLAYVRELGLDATIARVFNTYGPRMRGDDLYGRVVDRFLRQALANRPLTVYGDGSQTRSFCYVADTVRGLVTLLDRGRPGETYNVGSHEETRILDLAQIVQRLTGTRSEIEFRPLPPDDPKRRVPNTSKIRNLGWSPEVSLEPGLRRTLESVTG